MFKRFLRTAIALSIVGTLFAYNLVPAFAYTVQGGDTLGKIAAANNISVAELMELNGITNANQIYKGEDLKVSKEDTTVVTRQAEGSPFKGAAKTTATISSKSKAMLKGMFDLEYYKKNNPDVVAALGESETALFDHFCKYGIWEGRQVNPDFNVSAYASAYSDLTDVAKEKKMSAADEILFLYQHYEAFGKTENREVTTIEKAAEKGIAVVSVASAKTADGQPMAGTVIAAPAPKADPAPSAPAAPSACSHTYTYSTIDDDYCLAHCTKCGFEYNMDHDFGMFTNECQYCGASHSHAGEAIIYDLSSSGWLPTATQHYKVYADCLGKVGASELENHSWNGDNVCDDCGYTCSSHNWNGDDTCDYCGTVCSHPSKAIINPNAPIGHILECDVCDKNNIVEAHNWNGDDTCDDVGCGYVCRHNAGSVSPNGDNTHTISCPNCDRDGDTEACYVYRTEGDGTKKCLCGDVMP